MAKRSTSINLLKSNKNGTLEQAINWSLTIGRVLVIGVELIALGAFLFRFGLDRQIIDLHTLIKNKQIIVSDLKQSEDTYRNLQDRLAVAASFSNVGANQVKIFTDIVSFAPVGLTFNQISFDGSNIRIDANVTSVEPLSSFVAALKAYAPVDSVSLDKIENKTTNAIINVSMTVQLKQKGVVNEVTNGQ